MNKDDLKYNAEGYRDKTAETAIRAADKPPKSSYQPPYGDVMIENEIDAGGLLNGCLGEIFQMNIDKLKARYPEGFSEQRANNRSEGDI